MPFALLLPSFLPSFSLTVNSLPPLPSSASPLIARLLLSCACPSIACVRPAIDPQADPLLPHPRSGKGGGHLRWHSLLAPGVKSVDFCSFSFPYFGGMI